MHFRDLAIQNNKNEISCVIERPFSFAKTEPFLEGVGHQSSARTAVLSTRSHRPPPPMVAGSSCSLLH